MATATKKKRKEKKKLALGRPALVAGSGHKTNLKQSILRLSISMFRTNTTNTLHFTSVTGTLTKRKNSVRLASLH
jgi:hypothetical protein